MSEEIENTSRGSGGRPSLRFEKLFGKVRSINFFKTKLIKSHQKWDKKLAQAIDILKVIEKTLKSSSKATNAVKIGGEIGVILGSVTSICAIFVSNKETSAALTRIGNYLTVGGTVTAKGSNLVNKTLTNSYCKKAKRTMDALTKITQQLEEERKEYFRLLNEYETLLDELNEKELEILYNYIEEKDLDNFMNDLRLDSSVENRISPNLQEMDQLKMNEDVANVKIFQFNLIPKISEEMKNDPLLKHILSMKCQSLPFVNGENAIKAVQTVSKLPSVSPVVDLMGFNTKLCELRNSPITVGLTNAVLLIDTAMDIFFTITNFDQLNAQCEEIGRIAEELKEYRTDVKYILSKTLKWEYSEDNSRCIEDRKYEKLD